MKHFTTYIVAGLWCWATLIPLHGQGLKSFLSGGVSSTPTATLPLDEVGTAAGAYSVARRLRAAYSGNALQVRRASDGTTQDIGFSGDDVDSAAIATFCSGTTGYVTTIYDQSGNSRNLDIATTTLQPIIYQSGAVVTGGNSRVSCIFDGVDDYLDVYFTFSNAEISYHIVYKPLTSVTNDTVASLGSNGRGAFKQLATGPVMRFSSGTNLDGPSVSNGVWYFASVGLNTAGNDFIAKNGGTATTGDGGTAGATGILLGNASATANFEFSELIVYPAGYDSGNATTLFNNADAYYAIP